MDTYFNANVFVTPTCSTSLLSLYTISIALQNYEMDNGFASWLIAFFMVLHYIITTQPCILYLPNNLHLVCKKPFLDHLIWTWNENKALAILYLQCCFNYIDKGGLRHMVNCWQSGLLWNIVVCSIYQDCIPSIPLSHTIHSFRLSVLTTLDLGKKS